MAWLGSLGIATNFKQTLCYGQPERPGSEDVNSGSERARSEADVRALSP